MLSILSPATIHDSFYRMNIEQQRLLEGRQPVTFTLIVQEIEDDLVIWMNDWENMTDRFHIYIF